MPKARRIINVKSLYTTTARSADGVDAVLFAAQAVQDREQWYTYLAVPGKSMGSEYIQNVADKRWITVKGAAVLLTEDENEKIAWDFVPVEDGFAILLAANRNLCWTIGGKDVILVPYEGREEQVFNFQLEI